MSRAPALDPDAEAAADRLLEALRTEPASVSSVRDPDEASSADPTLLGMLEKAIRKKGRLGEVVEHVNELLGQQSKKYSPLDKHLDEDHKKRQISAPDR